MNDSVLIERLEPVGEESGILLPDNRHTNHPILRKGKVLAAGPGRWIPGAWWKVNRTEWQNYPPSINGPDELKEWEWIPGYRETPQVKPGDLVLFNARWNDLCHAELKPIGSDVKSRTAPLERPLSYRFDPTIHLVQEADIAGILNA